MPNSPDPLPAENEDDDYIPTPDKESNVEYRARTHTLIRELRRIYGPHFAPGYQDTDTLGHLLANAGLNTLEEYLSRHHIP